MAETNGTRRDMIAKSLLGAGAAVGAAGLARTARAAAPAANLEKTFRFGLNMATIRGFRLPIDKQVETAEKAGYDAIEPWIGDINRYASQGGNLGDLKKRIADAGLTVEGAVGFARWLVDDDAQRATGLEQSKRDMETVAKIGGLRIAAPAAGANRGPAIELAVAAERYRALLEVGDEAGVVPALELWGASANLSRLGDCAYIAIESGHPKACLLPDVYHIFRGGSDFTGLRLLDGDAIPVMHMNDYPADPPREQLNDGHRIYPGDGVAPLGTILGDLAESGGQTVLSLELFNRSYWQQDPMTVAQTGLRKMKEAVAKAAG